MKRLLLMLALAALLLVGCGGRTKKFDTCVDSVHKVSDTEKQKLWDSMSEKEKDEWR